MTEMPINDPDARLLAGIAVELETAYTSDEAEWIDSPFGWIKRQPSRRAGKIFEQLVAGWCAAKGFSVAAAPNSHSDRVIGGLKVEIKGSTLWKGGGFKFQQIRDQDYDIVICLGIRPFDVNAWAIPKAVLMEHPDGVASQHVGQAGRDTAWLAFDADNPPRWLHEWGGRLADAHRALRRLTGTA